MQRIDLMEAIAHRPFYKEPKKRYGLMATLLLSNAFWIVIVTILFVTVFTLTKTGSYLTAQWIEQNAKLSQLQAEEAKAIADRDAQISSLLKSVTASNSDILQMARSIQKVYNTANNSSQMRFLDEALPEALRIQIKEGIPASAVLAQAIYESSYGNSQLAREYHNYHGIKAFSNWTGPRASSMPTLEYGTTPIVADFRAYSSMAEGFDGYAQFLKSSDRYSSAFDQKTGMGFVQEVVKDGYCPDPHYLGSIKEIIERHNLTVLDEIYSAQVTKASVPQAHPGSNS
jgi:flagellum-specific peptidoglycan hydrolase FlgJ